MTWRHDYYREMISIALDEAPPSGVTLTPEQLDHLIGAVADAVENESMASGENCIPTPPSPAEADLRKRVSQLEQDLAARDKEIHAYRSSVAARRRVRIEDVYVDRHGHVVYGKG
jgi:hypothetical protein